MTPTDEQLKAIDIFRSGLTAKVNAFAGTGKTTTLLEMARSTSRKGIYLAFNRKIADEAGSSFPCHVQSSSTHAFARRALGSFANASPGKLGRSLNGNQIAAHLKIRDIVVDSKLTVPTPSVGHLVSQALTRFSRSGDREVSAQHVPIYGKLHACDEEARKAFLEHIADLARIAWQRMQIVDDPLPLSHDNYLKLWALSEPTLDADFVLLDEAQDSNQPILDVLSAQSCQVIYVGDRHQQIYEWRGAVNAMEKLSVEVESQLTQSFRFGPDIANIANGILHDLGESKRLIGNPDVHSRINEGYLNAVLCRTNAGVLNVVLEELSKNRIPHVEKGVADLIRLLRDVERLQNSIPGESDEFFGFSNWREVVDFSRTEDGNDLKPIVGLIEKFGARLLLDRLALVATNPAEADLIVSTAHKAKGLEWSGVEICSDFVRKNQHGRIELRSGDEERRLLYVAVTRAKEALHLPAELLEALKLAGSVSARIGERRPDPRRAHALRTSEDRQTPEEPTENGDADFSPARAIGKTWRSRTGSAYQNTWLDACVLSARSEGNNIVLSYIDITGEEVTITDYGRQGLRHEVLSYLRAGSPSRKVFLITHAPTRPDIPKLASDTMLLAEHRAQWA